MRRILPVLLAFAVSCVLLAVPASAQRGGGHGGGGGHAGGGMRGGSFGGGRGFSGSGFRGSGGFRSGGGFRGGFRGVGGFRGRYGYGYGFYGPWLYGGLWDPYLWDSSDWGDYGYPYPDYGYGYSAPSYSQPSPNVLIISNQQPAPEPAYVVQGPPAPQVWNAPPAEQANKYQDPLFLLAMKDGTIRAVLAYWVDGMTVHYVTMDHQQKQTPLSSLDHSLSERLNRERNVTFSLPG